MPLHRKEWWVQWRFFSILIDFRGVLRKANQIFLANAWHMAKLQKWFVYNEHCHIAATEAPERHHIVVNDTISDTLVDGCVAMSKNSPQIEFIHGKRLWTLVPCFLASVSDNRRFSSSSQRSASIPSRLFRWTNEAHDAVNRKWPEGSANRQFHNAHRFREISPLPIDGDLPEQRRHVRGHSTHIWQKTPAQCLYCSDMMWPATLCSNLMSRSYL